MNFQFVNPAFGQFHERLTALLACIGSCKGVLVTFVIEQRVGFPERLIAFVAFEWPFVGVSECDEKVSSL
jgi:hypothetical protein